MILSMSGQSERKQMKTSISILLLLVMAIFFSCCVSEEDVKISSELQTKFEQLRPGDTFYVNDWNKEEYSKYISLYTKQKAIDGNTYKLTITYYVENKINARMGTYIIKTDLDNRIKVIEKE